MIAPALSRRSSRGLRLMRKRPELSVTFWPSMPNTGLIQGVTQADQTVSYGAMAERQGRLAEEILKEPLRDHDVERDGRHHRGEGDQQGGALVVEDEAQGAAIDAPRRRRRPDDGIRPRRLWPHPAPRPRPPGPHPAGRPRHGGGDRSSASRPWRSAIAP
jgi:hypothetical protein